MILGAQQEIPYPGRIVVYGAGLHIGAVREQMNLTIRRVAQAPRAPLTSRDVKTIGTNTLTSQRSVIP